MHGWVVLGRALKWFQLAPCCVSVLINTWSIIVHNFNEQRVSTLVGKPNSLISFVNSTYLGTPPPHLLTGCLKVERNVCSNNALIYVCCSNRYHWATNPPTVYGLSHSLCLLSHNPTGHVKCLWDHVKDRSLPAAKKLFAVRAVYTLWKHTNSNINKNSRRSLPPLCRE